MTARPHDQLAKRVLEELLTPLGQVQVNLEVTTEARYPDLWFQPIETPESERQLRGLLAQLTTDPCLLEPFSTALNNEEVENCLLKLLMWRSDLKRQVKRDGRKLTKADQPLLWLLVPTASKVVRTAYHLLKPASQPPGVYLSPPGYGLGLVVIHQLPSTPDTLWLRLLGRGRLQQRAIAEFNALPKDHPLRSGVAEVLADRLAILERKDRAELQAEEVELMVNLSPTYLQLREEWQRQAQQQGWQEGRQKGLQEGLQEGRQEGLQEGAMTERRLLIENLLKVRFGEKDPITQMTVLDQEMELLVNPLVKLAPEELTQLMLQLSILTREELLARFQLHPPKKTNLSD